MAPEQEERQLQEALVKLQSQIDEQKRLVQKMLSIKQQRIENEKKKLLQLQSIVSQQNHIEAKEKKQQGNNKNAIIRILPSASLKDFDESTMMHTVPSLTLKENMKDDLIHKLPSLVLKENLNISHNSKVSKPTKKTSKNSSKQNYKEILAQHAFAKKIINKRSKFYYKNRFFFSGYKFLLVFDDTKLMLVSTNHEITKKPLTNADPLPLFITYKGRTYIKTSTGDYQLENLNKR
jgi:hypothetical protein